MDVKRKDIGMRSGVIILGLLLVCAQARAERIELKNGDIYQGKITERTDEVVTLSTAGAPIYLPADQIKSIGEDGPVPAAAVAPAGETGGGVAAAQAPLAGSDYSSKTLKCSFKIPEGFAVSEEDDHHLLLLSEENTFGVMVSRMEVQVVPSEKEIDAVAIELVMRQLGVSSPEELQNLVKLYGPRTVSNQHAFWLYYPVLEYNVFNHRTFIAGKDKSIYEVNISFPFTKGKDSVADGDHFANAFLAGFRVD